MRDRVVLDVTVNGRLRSALVEPRTTLGDFLRRELGLTGTHIGCDQGVCGACTVLLDDRPIRSCLLLAAQAHGAEVTTVEGVGGEKGLHGEEGLHVLQRAFLERATFQCGFCTSGFVMSGIGFLARNPKPTREEIVTAVSSNLCRCTGYASIVDAVELAAERLASEVERA